MLSDREPGPKLDKLVAEAVGIKVELREWNCGEWDCWRIEPDCCDETVFQPSTDTSDAMEAARLYLAGKEYPERYRFAHALRETLGLGDNRWDLLFERLMYRGPIAICEAILAAKVAGGDDAN